MSQLNVGKVVAGVGVELPTLAESNSCLLYTSDAADE